MYSLGFPEVGWQQISKKAAHRHQGDGLLALRVVDPAPQQLRQARTDATGYIDGIVDHGLILLAVKKGMRWKPVNPSTLYV
jgi:hypothetical protein